MLVIEHLDWTAWFSSRDIPLYYCLPSYHPPPPPSSLPLSSLLTVYFSFSSLYLQHAILVSASWRLTPRNRFLTHLSNHLPPPSHFEVAASGQDAARNMAHNMAPMTWEAGKLSQHCRSSPLVSLHVHPLILLRNIHPPHPLSQQLPYSEVCANSLATRVSNPLTCPCHIQILTFAPTLPLQAIGAWSKLMLTTGHSSTPKTFSFR